MFSCIILFIQYSKLLSNKEYKKIPPEIAPRYKLLTQLTLLTLFTLLTWFTLLTLSTLLTWFMVLTLLTLFLLFKLLNAA